MGTCRSAASRWSSVLLFPLLLVSAPTGRAMLFCCFFRLKNHPGLTLYYAFYHQPVGRLPLPQANAYTDIEASPLQAKTHRSCGRPQICRLHTASPPPPRATYVYSTPVYYGALAPLVISFCQPIPSYIPGNRSEEAARPRQKAEPQREGSAGKTRLPLPHCVGRD